MDYFFKYTSINEQDVAWRLYLNVAGSYCYPPNASYPSKLHPAGYFFSWDKGRVIDEYQIIYITRGEGIFETKNATYKIKSGTILILRKGQWHRYKPLKETGWTENYIGFNGELAGFYLQSITALRNAEVVELGEQEVLLDTFYKISALVNNEPPCFQQIASGLILQLLGLILSLQSQKIFSENNIEKTIQDIRFYIREHVEEPFNFEELTQKYETSCSHLRKMFKQYTGKSPHQYYLDMKIIRAKELVLNSNMSIKEIAISLGFESIHYFSRLFKAKTGKSPADFRRIKD